MSFFVIVVIVPSLMYGYVGWRLIVPAAFSLPVNIMLWASVVLLLVLPFLPIVTRMRTIDAFWVDLVSWIAYLSFGVMTVLFAFLFARDVLWLIALGYQKSFVVMGAFVVVCGIAFTLVVRAGQRLALATAEER